MLRSGFPGDHVDGMACFVQKLKASLNTRLRNDKSKTVLVDFGCSCTKLCLVIKRSRFYQSGIITHKATVKFWNEGGESRDVLGARKTASRLDRVSIIIKGSLGRISKIALWYSVR